MSAPEPLCPLKLVGACQAQGADPAQAAQLDDDSLVLLASAGRLTAFDALVRRYQAQAIRVAYRFCADSALAEDIAQNAFLEIYRALDSYRPQGKFQAYLWRVVVNHCRMSWRATRSQEKRNRQIDARGDVDALSEEAVIDRERQREVDRALSNLSEKLRTVIVLRFSAGLSMQEIADSLEIPVGTVKRRLFDGLTKLREHMEEA